MTYVLNLTPSTKQTKLSTFSSWVKNGHLQKTHSNKTTQKTKQKMELKRKLMS